MILRLLFALVGAGVITSAMLLGMSKVTELFRERGSERFFLVTDVLLRDHEGRMQRPPAAELPPDRPAVELDAGRSNIRVGAPGGRDPAAIIDAEVAPPTIEGALAPDDKR